MRSPPATRGWGGRSQICGSGFGVRTRGEASNCPEEECSSLDLPKCFKRLRWRVPTAHHSVAARKEPPATKHFIKLSCANSGTSFSGDIYCRKLVWTVAILLTAEVGIDEPHMSTCPESSWLVVNRRLESPLRKSNYS